MTTYQQTDANGFETQTCTRCGGSGHHSYCQMYGTTCFKCHGAGKVYTKRGRAAVEHWTRLMSKQAGELQPGDKIRERGIRGWCTVQAVGYGVIGCSTVDQETGEQRPIFGIKTDRVGLGTPEDTLVRVAQTAEQKRAKLEQALAYQATLTKQGKPRKR